MKFYAPHKETALNNVTSIINLKANDELKLLQIHFPDLMIFLNGIRQEQNSERRRKILLERESERFIEVSGTNVLQRVFHSTMLSVSLSNAHTHTLHRSSIILRKKLKEKKAFKPNCFSRPSIFCFLLCSEIYFCFFCYIIRM